jgi:hypothetical protein
MKTLIDTFKSATLSLLSGLTHPLDRALGLLTYIGNTYRPLRALSALLPALLVTFVCIVITWSFYLLAVVLHRTYLRCDHIGLALVLRSRSIIQRLDRWAQWPLPDKMP